MFNKAVIDEITKVANDNGIEPAALLAVADVESAGTAFWNVGGKALPAIRFEGHYFYKLLPESQRADAVAQGLASPKAGAVKNPNNFAARYALFERAAKINRAVAIESTSWGLGQVMGAHWNSLGYSSAEDLYQSAQSISGQVDMMIRFIKQNSLDDEIADHKWAAFAKAYNGAGYKKNAYDTKLAKKYDEYSTSPEAAGVEEILQLQKMLNVIHSDYKLTEDGEWGAQTKAALRDFQLKNGLKVDGVYGPLSRQEVEHDYLEIVNNKDKTTGIGATTIASAGTALSEVAKQVEPLAKVSQIAQYVFLGLLVVAALLALKPYLFPKRA